MTYRHKEIGEVIHDLRFGGYELGAQMLETQAREIAELRAQLNQCAINCGHYQTQRNVAIAERDALRARAEAVLNALNLAYDAMRAPIDDWKGVLERKAMDAYHAAIAAGANT